MYLVSLNSPHLPPSTTIAQPHQYGSIGTLSVVPQRSQNSGSTTAYTPDIAVKAEAEVTATLAGFAGG